MIDPVQLLDIASELTAARGRPRIGALRRSISTSYYALFHFLLTQATDWFVGGVERNTARYDLVYRSFEYTKLKTVCSGISAGQFTIDGQPFCDEIRKGAAIFVELQNSRHEADYKPSARITLSDARAAITKAREAVRLIGQAYNTNEADWSLFLTLLSFKSRT